MKSRWHFCRAALLSRAFLPAALFVVSGGRDAYNLEERKAGKEISAALHAAVRAGREIKDMVDGSGYA